MIKENEKTAINIDGIQYQYEDLSQEQKMIVNHCVDLDRKIDSAKFNLDQLQVGKQAFLNMLRESLINIKANDGNQESIRTAS